MPECHLAATEQPQPVIITDETRNMRTWYISKLPIAWPTKAEAVADINKRRAATLRRAKSMVARLESLGPLAG